MFSAYLAVACVASFSVGYSENWGECNKWKEGGRGGKALFGVRPNFPAANKRRMLQTCGKPYGNACYVGLFHCYMYTQEFPAMICRTSGSVVLFISQQVSNFSVHSFYATILIFISWPWPDHDAHGHEIILEICTWNEFAEEILTPSFSASWLWENHNGRIMFKISRFVHSSEIGYKRKVSWFKDWEVIGI